MSCATGSELTMIVVKPNVLKDTSSDSAQQSGTRQEMLTVKSNERNSTIFVPPLFVFHPRAMGRDVEEITDQWEWFWSGGLISIDSSIAIVEIYEEEKASKSGYDSW